MCNTRPALYRGIRQVTDTGQAPTGGGRMKWPARHPREANDIPGPTESRLLGPVRLGMLALGAIAVVALATVTLLASLSSAQLLVTSTYRFDPINEEWVKTVETERLPPNADGTQPKGSHTIVIELDDDEPVKGIWIEEVLITGDSGPDLEVRGRHSSTSSGDIIICNLLMQKVDAEELEIDGDVARMEILNVVADDDELDLDLEVKNVIRCGRGGASVLFLGLGRRELVDKILDIDEFFDFPEGLPERETGLRVDKIVIVGPSGGDGFIEHLIIRQTSVFGKIEIEDVEIQHLILKDVTLDD
jgi:hypothetical protein